MAYQHKRRVKYYETDQMGVVHHANYLHWFEEARTEYMRKQGVSYKELEEAGIILPVAEVNCKYQKPAYYDDLLVIIVEVAKLKRIKVDFEYQIKRDDELIVTGNSSHPFVDEDFSPLHFKRERPKLWEQIFGAVNIGA